MEFQCAKEDGGLTGLKILDEPAYLKPLLIKLPEELQGRWQRHAYRFKSQHGVDYPRVCLFHPRDRKGKERSGPYLSIESQEKKDLHLVKPPVRPPVKPPIKPPTKPPIKPADIPPFGQGFNTFRTDVSDPTSRGPVVRDPAKWCVIHKLSHPLSKCRAFRAMPLAERKTLLSQQGICFHCLASTNHLAKDCTVQVKCSECHSDNHVAALHAGPPSKPPVEGREPGDAHQQGGEPSNVTSSCTEVCGSTTGGKSCAKICLANSMQAVIPRTRSKLTWSLTIKATAHWPSQNCLIC